jgi:HSP20 family protein
MSVIWKSEFEAADPRFPECGALRKSSKLIHWEVNNMAKSGTQIAPLRGFRGLSRDPFRELFDLQRGLNQLLDASFETPREDVPLKAWAPPVDIYEDDNAFLIKLELPEVSRDEVKVNLNENTLSISGERRVENEQKRENYHRVERSYGQFYRSFTLPPNVNPEGINAQFKDGVLRLTLPKREEAKPKQIEVKVQ